MPEFDVEAFVSKLERLGVKLTSVPLADGKVRINRWRMLNAGNNNQQIQDLWNVQIGENQAHIDLLAAYLAHTAPPVTASRLNVSRAMAGLEAGAPNPGLGSAAAPAPQASAPQTASPYASAPQTPAPQKSSSIPLAPVALKPSIPQSATAPPKYVLPQLAAGPPKIATPSAALSAPKPTGLQGAPAAPKPAPPTYVRPPTPLASAGPAKPAGAAALSGQQKPAVQTPPGHSNGSVLPRPPLAPAAAPRSAVTHAGATVTKLPIGQSATAPQRLGGPSPAPVPPRPVGPQITAVPPRPAAPQVAAAPPKVPSPPSTGGLHRAK